MERTCSNCTYKLINGTFEKCVECMAKPGRERPNFEPDYLIGDDKNAKNN